MGERTDWRIPTKDELMQVSLDSCAVTECAESYSGNDMYNYNSTFATTHWFWSLSEVEGDEAKAWCYGLELGYIFAIEKTFSGTARVCCVARD